MRTAIHAQRHEEALARALEMKALLDQGYTLRDIGQKYGGISKQRVKQVLDKFGFGNPKRLNKAEKALKRRKGKGAERG